MPTIKVIPEIQQEIYNYRRFMLDNEYTDHTALGYSTYLSRFLRLTSLSETNSLQEQVYQFLEKQRLCIPNGTYKECRAAIRLYYKMVTGGSLPKPPRAENNPEIEAILNRFYDYSIDIKRIQQTTALGEISWIRRFLQHTYGEVSCRFESITANGIRDFVMDQLAHLSDSSKGGAVTAIRNFFRFLKFDGIPIHESIFLLPLSPAVWKNAAFPTTIDESVFNRLHEVPREDTPSGKRNRCIILCFTELALRCIEVATLSIDDFSWHEGHVTIKNTKTHADRSLPISEKLGKALVEYLQEIRPQTACRTLFVRFKHPCGEPMGSSQIRGVVRRAYGKSGAEIKSTGTHILRRTAGTKLYNAGNSLKMTADILGHASLDSTVRYTKADLIGLRTVAAPWPNLIARAGDRDVK